MPPAVPERLLRKASRHLPGTLAALRFFMTVRNCFLAPSNPCKAAQRLEQCLPDCFGRPFKRLSPCAVPPAVPERLLRKASRQLPCYLGRTPFLWPSETAFWHPQTLVRLRSALSSASQTASEGLSNASNPAQCLQQCPRDCFGRPRTPASLLPWPHIVFMTVRNCFLAPSNPCKAAQRLEQCLPDCFGRPFKRL